MSATNTALTTFDILEQILLHLSLPDLLRALQINKAFQSTLSDSLSLPRALFLKLAPTHDKHGKIVRPKVNTPLLPTAGRRYRGEVYEGFRIYSDNRESEGGTLVPQIPDGDSEDHCPRHPGASKLQVTVEREPVSAGDSPDSLSDR